jgi:hypothetical protein
MGAKKGFIFFLIVGPILFALGIAGYFVFSDEAYKLASIAFASLMLIVNVIVLIDHFLSPHKRLEKKLSSVNSITQGEDLEKMKSMYKDIYGIYLKCSNKHKKNYYANVVELRERIERKLKASKKLEILIENIGKGTIKQQEKNYNDLHAIYQRLPEPMQKKYYHHLIHAKELLTKGK